jgi:hypothetical protein
MMNSSDSFSAIYPEDPPKSTFGKGGFRGDLLLIAVRKSPPAPFPKGVPIWRKISANNDLFIDIYPKLHYNYIYFTYT